MNSNSATENYMRICIMTEKRIKSGSAQINNEK